MGEFATDEAEDETYGVEWLPSRMIDVCAGNGGIRLVVSTPTPACPWALEYTDGAAIPSSENSDSELSSRSSIALGCVWMWSKKSIEESVGGALRMDCGMGDVGMCNVVGMVLPRRSAIRNCREGVGKGGVMGSGAWISIDSGAEAYAECPGSDDVNDGRGDEDSCDLARCDVVRGGGERIVALRDEEARGGGLMLT